ncbi:HAMP domain-containing histidine kinase [Lysinibacillus sp. KU-BSD001]|uniref:HAMP domain-containing sensor histidine kinase n=1 Tax=Lysinibacillus sp. KU-BSD001 TaxID=3141328 RepID=UPI0036E816BD
MKLNTKVNILSTLLTLIILISSYTGIYFLFKNLAYDTEYAQLQNRADELVAAVSILESVENIDSLLQAYIPPNGSLRVVNEQDKPLFYMHTLASPERIPYTIEKNTHFTVSLWNQTPVMAMAYPLIWPDHTVVTVELVQPLHDIAKNMELLKWILILMTLAAMVPIYLASVVLVRIIVRPIQSLTTTMQKNIETSRYEQITLQNHNRDEIAEMTQTYNKFMQQVETNYTKQQQFIGNASHELKTPLTVIESYAKLLERRGFSNEAVNKEALAAILKETSNMKQLMEQMLQLAKASEQPKVEWATVDIQSLLTDISQSMKQAYGTDIIISGENITVASDEAKLKQLLFIFLDNARKYSEKTIDVHIVSGDLVKICVTDYGVGIPEEDIPHLFDRFYRVDKARNRKTGGTGLGLAIAKQLADLLKIDMAFTSKVGVGTTVTLSFTKRGTSDEK